MDVSVILSTYNRARDLWRALESLSRQVATGITYEIIVVDNNSSDSTKDVIRSFVERDGRFRYLSEPRQGLSYARNAGIAAAAASLLVFTDDDVEFEPSWILENYRASLRYPDADFFGGKVLPIWHGPPPAWIKCTMDPLALSDLGDQPIVIQPPDRAHCLVGASLAIRRRAFAKAGLFSTATQRIKNGIGSTEDWDWEVKVWQYGGHGMYVPDIVCRTQIPVSRLRKSYHRRWYAGNGKFHAISGRPELQGSNRLLNVPLFIYRLTAATAARALWSRLTRQQRAFSQELRFWYYTGAIRHYWGTWVASERQSKPSPATQPSATQSS